MMKALFNDIFITEATNGIGAKVFAALTGVSNYTLLGSDSKPTLTFYKGVMPADTEMNGFIASSRSSDALLQFNNASSPFTRTNKRVTFNYGPTVFGTILGEGDITWFATGTNGGSGLAPYNNIPMFFGTVGLTGSGADLEIHRVNVTTASLWLCTDLGFDLSNELIFS